MPSPTRGEGASATIADRGYAQQALDIPSPEPGTLSRKRLQTAHPEEARMFKPMIAALACALFATPSLAQDYPTKPIRIIVPFGPGGGGDIVGRIFGQALQEKLGQPVVVENKPGAAGTIGNELVARAEKDGYTIGVMTAGQIIAAR